MGRVDASVDDRFGRLRPVSSQYPVSDHMKSYTIANRRPVGQSTSRTRSRRRRS